MMRKIQAPEASRSVPQEIRIGISSCLLGERVRFDGGHKRDAFLTQTLSQFVAFVPVCPEMDIGLGAPRESMRLVEADAGPRLLAPRSGTDHTAAMQRYARAKVRELTDQDLCGFILKKDSPTCGMERVRVYSGAGMPTRRGRGLFAEALIDASPLLPIEEEGRLGDPKLRENFFERVFGYRRLRTLFAGDWSQGDLVHFHTAEKYLLLSHHTEGYRALGQLVAGAKKQRRDVLQAEYSTLYMATLAKRATPGRHANVLQHMLGYLKRDLADDEKQEVMDLVAAYKAGLVPLIVPLTLLRHHVRRFRVEYLRLQQYLEPHPRELMLRNHV